MATILVTGATGTLGREVVRQAVGRGHNVRAYVREADASLPQGVAAYPGDIRTGTGLPEATKGVDAIIHCATFFEAGNVTDLEGARHLIAAASENGSPHLVYISIVGIDHSKFSYFQGKLAIERMIEKSGLPFTILRGTQFHDFVLKLIASFADEKDSTIVLPAGLRFQSVDASEVAEELVTLATQPPVGRATDMGGPEILTLEDMAKAYGRNCQKGHVIRSETQPTASDFHDAFRSDSNLVPDRAVGRTTWEAFLRRRL
jgi:uncharacterized protein YbjT (DUF2867 family)